MKYNFGSANKRFDGFQNVDIVKMPSVDIVWDLRKTPYPFVKQEVEEIIAQEILEHIEMKYTKEVLVEWYRILKSGGKLVVQVPDIGKMCEMYSNKEICDCVPHKAVMDSDFKANPNCWNCGGKGKINSVRWFYAFTGTQKHIYEQHKNIFTQEILENLLRSVGFNKIKKVDNLYKLVYEAIK